MTYIVEKLNAKAFTERLNTAVITGPLRVTPPPYRQSTGWRSSSLAGCLRMVGYRLLGAAQTHDTYNPDWTLSADIGTTIHTRIQEQLVTSGMAVTINGTPAIEVELTGAPFSGHIDAVIRTKQGTIAVFDIKSGAPREFAPGYRYLADKQQKWAVQLSSYMAYFSLPGGERATEAYVLHINRGDTSDRNLFRIPWQPERFAADFARLSTAQTVVKAGELPPAEPGACRFCAFRGHCEANDYAG